MIACRRWSLINSSALDSEGLPDLLALRHLLS